MEENIGVKMEKCFLCLKTFRDNSPGNNVDKGIAFKMLLRFLKVDVSKLAGSEACDGIRDREHVTFCENCSPLMRDFYEWYKNLDSVLLCLNECLHAVHQVLEKSEKCKSGVFGDQSAPERFSSFSGILREETRRRCQLKIRSSPFVQLENVNAVSITSEENEDAMVEERPISPQQDEDLHDPLPDSMIAEAPITCKNEDANEVAINTASMTCTLCNQEFKNKNSVREHSLRKHAFHLYSNQLPLSVTSEQLEHAINSIAKSGQGVKGCLRCPTRFRRSGERRLHILKTHMPQIIQMLEGNSSESLEIPCLKPFSSRKKLSSRKIAHQQRRRRIFSRPFDSRSISYFKCKFCPHSSPVQRDIRVHTFNLHMIQALGDRLPQGVKEEELKASMAKILASAKQPHYNTLQSDFDCPYCSLVKGTTRLRLQLHILEAHLEKVLSILKPVIDEIAIPTEAKNGMISPLKEVLPAAATEMKSSSPSPLKPITLTCQNGEWRKINTPLKTFPVTCTFCNHEAQNHGRLRLHKMRKHTLQLFSNQLPPNTSSYQLEQAVHKIVTNPQGFLGCNLCSRGFRNVDEKRLHILARHFQQVIPLLEDHSGEEIVPKPKPSHSCPTCLKSFDNRGKLFFHKRTHLKRRPRVIQSKQGANFKSSGKHFNVACPFCSFTTKENSLLRRHSLRKHAFQLVAEQLPPFTTPNQLEKVISDMAKLHQGMVGCLWCARGCSRQADKRIHILKCHLERIIQRLQNTPIPPNGILQMENLASSNFHENPPPPKTSHFCFTCQKSFSNRGKLLLHKKTHQQNKAKGKGPKNRAKCDFCDYTASSRTDVNVHMYAYHAVQILTDKVGPGVTEGQLRATMNKILDKAQRHMKKKDKSTYLACPYCPTVRRRGKGRLQLHIFEIHIDKVLETLKNIVAEWTEDDENASKGVVKPQKEKVIPKCPHCVMTFTVVRNLKEHLLHDHGKGGPQKCPYCTYHFRGKKFDHHLKSVHTAAFFRNLLPPKITDEMFETTIRSFIKRTPGTAVYLCDLCEEKCHKIGDTKMHLMEHHQSTIIQSLQTASNSIKENQLDMSCQQESSHKGSNPPEKVSPGLKAHEFEAAIQNVLSKARVLFKEDNGLHQGYIGCPHCALDFVHLPQLRMHILCSHLNKVVSSLEKNKGGQKVTKEKLEFVTALGLKKV